jgi:hypothetical protein
MKIGMKLKLLYNIPLTICRKEYKHGGNEKLREKKISK